MSKRVIAIDPGEQTGWAIGTVLVRPDGRKMLTIDQYGYDDWKTFALTLDGVQKGDNPFDVIVYEDWRLRSDKAKAKIGSAFPEIQCIGAMKLSAWTSGAKLVTSTPYHKNVIDAQMEGTDYLPKRDRVEHYRDAVRHLCWYAVNTVDISPKNIIYRSEVPVEDHA